MSDFFMKAYYSLTPLERDELDDLAERNYHRDTMRFTEIDAKRLVYLERKMGLLSRPINQE